MSKKTLKAVTPAGEFTRTTDAEYTHVVVRTCPRAERERAEGRKMTSGVSARWAKDNLHAVSWHTSAPAAAKAAAGRYFYDTDAKVVGIFEVSP